MPRNSRSALLPKRHQRDQERRRESIIRLRRQLRRQWRDQIARTNRSAETRG